MVTFGTTYPAPAFKIEEIIKAAKVLPNLGFVFSLQEKWDSYKLVEKANLKNILLKQFVPQKELLNSDKVIAFISHAGANSCAESMYYGKFSIGFPTAKDQPGMAFRLEIMKAGISMGYNPNHKELIRVLTHITSNETNPFSEHMLNVKRNQRKLEFIELRSG